MSWSFSATEKTESDVIRVFENTVIENRHAIPDEIGERLKNAARTLANDSGQGKTITLSTAGHRNGEGVWNASISIIVRTTPEVSPDGSDDAPANNGDPVEEADTNEA